MAIIENEQLTPRETTLMEAERDENRLAREHAIQLKQLELALEREKNQAEVALRTLEAKWSSWLRLPSMIIKLPVYVFMGVGFVILCIRKTPPTKAFWDFIK